MYVYMQTNAPTVFKLIDVWETDVHIASIYYMLPHKLNLVAAQSSILRSVCPSM